MKKVLAIAVMMCIILCFIPIAESDTTVTGTFTPISTGISIYCNKTAPGFGNVNLGESAENISFNVTNEGDVNCSVTMTAEDGAGNFSLVAGTSSPSGADKYCVNMNPALAGYVDVYTQQTIVADMPAAGEVGNYTRFDLKIYLSTSASEQAPPQQTFFANLTAAGAT